jgi:hypothetical protein
VQRRCVSRTGSGGCEHDFVNLMSLGNLFTAFFY